MDAFSGKSSYPSNMMSLSYFTGAIVHHKLVSTPRAWGMNSPVTHILTPWKILIGLPGTSCEPIYRAGSHKYQTALCFPFLQCPGNLCFGNFLWMLTASIMHQQQRHVATRAQSCQKQRTSQRNTPCQDVYKWKQNEKKKKNNNNNTKQQNPKCSHTLQPTLPNPLLPQTL